MLKTSAKILSYIFHPLFILPYLMVFSWLSCKHLFTVLDPQNAAPIIAYTFVSALVLPIVAILMLKQLGFIRSLQMEDRMERIGPLIIIGVLYAWLCINFYRSNGQIPDPITMSTLGATIGLFLAFFLNNFFKISLHAVGIGGLIMASFIIATTWSYGFIEISSEKSLHIILALILILVVSGLVLSSRLILGAHNLYQMYHGFIVGIISQVIALRIMI